MIELKSQSGKAVFGRKGQLALGIVVIYLMGGGGAPFSILQPSLSLSFNFKGKGKPIRRILQYILEKNEV